MNEWHRILTKNRKKRQQVSHVCGKRKAESEGQEASEKKEWEV